MSVDTPSPEPNDDWSPDELERAYERALNAIDAIDTGVQAVEAVAEQLVEEISGDSSIAAPPAQPAEAAAPATPPAEQPIDHQVTPTQVIEACLFVGGAALTARKLASVLKGDYTAEFVEEAIDGLNQRYAVEQRPYEIRLGEGGYVLSLKDEFERIRFKAFGLGPKEVRLTQDAIEVLALVAYQQPITEAELSELGKPQCGGVLRQLLRRDLVAVERRPDDPKAIRYATTPRFLSLCGIGELDELPRPEEIGYK
jgi:segregation and condensation protein B